MPRCLMAKKWKAAAAAELADESDEEIDVVGEGRGRSPAPAATAPGPSPRDPEPTLLYNGKSSLAVAPPLLHFTFSSPALHPSYIVRSTLQGRSGRRECHGHTQRGRAILLSTPRHRTTYEFHIPLTAAFTDAASLFYFISP